MSVEWLLPTRKMRLVPESYRTPALVSSTVLSAEEQSKQTVSEGGGVRHARLTLGRGWWTPWVSKWEALYCTMPISGPSSPLISLEHQFSTCGPRAPAAAASGTCELGLIVVSSRTNLLGSDAQESMPEWDSRWSRSQLRFENHCFGGEPSRVFHWGEWQTACRNRVKGIRTTWQHCSDL